MQVLNSCGFINRDIIHFTESDDDCDVSHDNPRMVDHIDNDRIDNQDMLTNLDCLSELDPSEKTKWVHFCYCHDIIVLLNLEEIIE